MGRRRSGRGVAPVMEPRILIAAGEASGDDHGAGLVEAIREIMPGAVFKGLGGDKMAAAGVEVLVPARELAVVGFSAVFPKLKFFWQVLKGLERRIIHEKPDLVILIDFPDFNLRLAKRAHRAGALVFYYVSPQVWAWRRGRVKVIRRCVDRLAVLFPFEPGFFADHGVEVDFVGHPLADEIRPADRAALRGELGFDPGGRYVALMPGSRKSEVDRILPVLLGAARLMKEAEGDLEFVVPLAPTLSPGDLADKVAASGLGAKVIAEGQRPAMGAADVALTASGTATVELALMGTPMVVVYRIGRFNELMARALIRVPFVSMVNLIAGREVVPELLQQRATPELVAAAGLELLTDGDKASTMTRDLTEVRGRLLAGLDDGGAARRAAGVAVELMAGKKRER